MLENDNEIVMLVRRRSYSGSALITMCIAYVVVCHFDDSIVHGLTLASTEQSLDSSLLKEQNLVTVIMRTYRRKS